MQEWMLLVLSYGDVHEQMPKVIGSRKARNNRLRAHQTIALPISELAKRYRSTHVINKYIYDFTGRSNLTVWEKILGTHMDCRGFIDGKVLRFACFSCMNMHCYWRTEKEKLVKEGYEYE